MALLEDKKHLHLEVSGKLFSDIKEIAKEKETAVNAFIREILKIYVEEHKNK